MKSLHVLLAATVLMSGGCAFQHLDADLVVHNARIVTLDSADHVYQAMAIKDGRILELGPERAILNKYTATRMYDAAGHTVYPGFIDAHCHFFGYGLNKQKVDLGATKDWAEVLARTEAFARTRADTGWILGRGWDQNDWADKRMPDNAELNARFPDRPVLLQRIDGHAAVANQAALDRVGLSAASVIAGGLMEVRNGRPTGLLVDNAVDVFQKIFDEADEATKRRALLDAQRDCLEVGLTTVCDAGLDAGTIALIERMQEEGVLKMRVYAMVADRPENLSHFAERGPVLKDRLMVRAVKVYADGALGSRGALLKQPYADVDTPHHGLLLQDRAHMEQVARWCKEHGFQMATHCIGDSADRFMLDVYAEQLGGANDLRWRIEHAQCIDPADLHLFAENSIIPSMQPTHLLSDGPWAMDRIGPERFKSAYAWNTLRKQMGIVALGTDFPVEGIDPLATYYAAVVRRNPDGSEIVGSPASEALSRRDALLGMTLWNALASFSEADLGSLEVGKRADLTIVDRDLEQADAAGLRAARVLATVIAGEVLHE